MCLESGLFSISITRTFIVVRSNCKRSNRLIVLLRTYAHNLECGNMILKIIISGIINLMTTRNVLLPEKLQ